MAQTCPYCGSELPEESRFCLNCMQYTVQPERIQSGDRVAKQKKHPALAWIVAGVALLCIVATATGGYLKNTDKVSATLSASESVNVQSTTVSENDIGAKGENVATGDTTDLGAASGDTASSAGVTTAPSAKAGTSSGGATGSESGGADSPSAVTHYRTSPSESETEANQSTRTTTAPTEKRQESAEKPQESKIIITGGVLRYYPATLTNKSYQIPYSVTKIADNAFSGNKYITSLTFSERESLDCNYANLFNSLPNLNTIYIYPGTSPDLDGKQYFWGKVVYL